MTSKQLSTISMLAGTLLLLGACSDADGGGTTSPTSSSGAGGSPSVEDERGSIGVPPPASVYCEKLGFKIEGDNCIFLDNTKCEQWSFYRGECGNPNSYCNKHGGKVSSKTEVVDTFTTVYAVCDLNGKQCKEIEFFDTGVCK